MKIGVFFGSRNPEHDISIITAQLIINGLYGLGHEVVPIYINKSGQWMIGEVFGKLATFTDANSGTPNDISYSKYYQDLEKSHGKLVFKQKKLAGKEVTIDLAFPALHGAYGEDGTIQGIFEMLDVPYVGCDVPSSAVSMNKSLTKQIFTANDISTTKFYTFSKKDWNENKKKMVDEISKLKWPIFIKPVHLGSSIGIAKVNKESELEDKINVALYYDEEVLAEEAVENLMDVTCCVIGNEDLTASELQESIFSKGLFDFDQKYLDNGGAQLGKAQSSIVIPARIDNKLTLQIKNTAKDVYRALGCSGIARIDFLLDTKTYFANEVNPLPGTLYHHLWEKSGVPLDTLLKKLIGFALDKAENKKKISSTFSSSVLTNLGSKKLSK